MNKTMKFGLSVALMAILGVAVLPAQRGGGGSRGALMNSPKPRLDAMELAFKLTKEQKAHVKTLMDEANKVALPIREGLIKTHADIALAIQAKKSQAEIDAATKAYADQATAMMALEVKTLAAIMKELTEEQRAMSAAISQTFFAMRSAFLNKNWNEIASESRNY